MIVIIYAEIAHFNNVYKCHSFISCSINELEENV